MKPGIPTDPRFQNLTGRKFGRLHVIKFRGRDPHRKGYIWECLCACGNTKIIHGGNLSKGTSSCGCLAIESIKRIATTHGRARTPEHQIWWGMLQRCNDPSCSSYEDYGAKGIKVAKRWMKFENFFEDMGLKPTPSHQLDRYPNRLGDYEPGNVRWTTCRENQRNRTNAFDISHNGVTQCLTAWAEQLGINMFTLWRRIRVYKWSIDKALTTPTLR